MTEYRGLVNQGSTCYLNSLIQTLFMTPEFRQNVYSYIHDEKKIAAIDSIPYQLQKLFVLLQLNENTVYTKGLLRSFQWDDVNSFQQHDVQQFCRILFQALQKASKGINWIEKLYSGLMQSFITCGNHPRSNQEMFMDISLPIKHPFTGTYYTSIEQCLKEYLLPQKLEGVECEGCGAKVQVQKGLRLNILSPILTLQINRFQLNYENMQRQKINNFLYFPQILQMWRFLKPYQQIKIKGLPKDLFDKVKLIEKQKSIRQVDWGIGKQLTITGKGLQRKKSFEQATQKKQVKFFDEQNKDKRQDETKKLSFQEQKIKNLQILKQLKADKEKLDKLGTKNNKKQQSDTTKIKQQAQQKQKDEQKKQKQNKNFVFKFAPAPAASSIEDDMLFGSFMDGFDRTGNQGMNQFQDIQISNETGKAKKGPRFEKTQAYFQHEQQKFDFTRQYPDNTYILSAVLVHSGGAFGGHYYAYIFDGKNWYCFNDNNVKLVSRQQIRKYGHPTEQTSYGANAYLLFYRQAKTFQTMKWPIQIPPELLQKVRNDKTVIEKATILQTLQTMGKRDYEQIKNRYSQIQNGVFIKIKHKGDQLQSIIIPNRHEQTVKGLKQLVKTNLNIQEDDKNWRLRRYNKSQDTLHQVYDSELDNKTLQQIGLRQTCYMAIQIKKDHETFDDYDPKNITVKLNVWRQGLTLLTQSCLKPLKLGIREENTFEEFYHKVQKITGIKKPLILKRNFSVGNPYQIFNLQANKDKTLISLRFFNGINLYVEEQAHGKLKWDKQFEDEKYKCQIKFNHPKQGTQKNHQLFFDTRKTLGDLKQKISELIGIEIQQFRLKKSQQSVSQMTQYKKRLVDLRFVNSQYLYIEQGKSSKGTIMIKKGIVNIVDQQIQFSLGEQYQLEIQGNISTVADLKVKLSQKYNISEFNIRVRQFKSHQFGQIFKDSQSLAKIKQKSLIWEELQIEDPKGMQIYIRIFDVMTLQLSSLHSIFVQPNANYQQLALIIEEETQIKSDKLLAHKIISNYVDRSLLFQCEWIQVKYISKSIRDEPLYLVSDGQILIIKQAETSYQPKANKKFTIGDGDTGGKAGKKQASLKITVVKEKEDAQLLQDQKKQNQQTQKLCSKIENQNIIQKNNQQNQSKVEAKQKLLNSVKQSQN